MNCKKFLAGILSATIIFGASATSAAYEDDGEIISEVPTDIYTWVQSTPRGNYWFNHKHCGYRVKEDGTLRVPGNGKAFYTAEELASTGVKLSVGAVRTRVFEIRPIGSRVTSDRTETDAAFDARFGARRSELERAAADDAEYERSNGDVVYDPMPVI